MTITSACCRAGVRACRLVPMASPRYSIAERVETFYYGLARTFLPRQHVAKLGQATAEALAGVRHYSDLGHVAQTFRQRASYSP